MLYLFLATTEKHKIIPTILSRCQIFDFNRIRVDDTVDYLEYIAKEENISYELDGLNIIAQKADGAMRDALSIFDQVVSFSWSNITYQGVIENLNVLDYDYYFKVTEAFVQNSISQALLIFNEILEKGFDAHHFINGLSEHFRNLLVCKDEVTLQLLEVGANIRDRYKEQTKASSSEFLLTALEISNRCDIAYKLSKNKRLHVELSLIELCNITVEKKNSSQLEIKPEIDQLETKKQEQDKPKVLAEKKTVQEKKNIPVYKNKSNSISTFSIKEKLDQNSKVNVVEEPIGKEIKVENAEEVNKEFNEKE